MITWTESLPNGHYTQHLSAEDLAKRINRFVENHINLMNQEDWENKVLID